jgi:hypothetical protein
MENIKIKLTKHAKIKIAERNISLDTIKNIIANPELIENDKFDDSLKHFIKKNDDRHYLRIIGRWENKNSFLIVSCFFDRRIKKYKR